MKNIFSFILKLILFIWQLPQNIIGCIILLINKNNALKKSYNNINYYIVNKGIGAGISLGYFIFLSSKSKNITLTDIMHEHGHQIQSLYFGLIYLVIIGLPSIFLNIFNYIDLFSNKNINTIKLICNYYNSFPEKWADKLGYIKHLPYDNGKYYNRIYNY